MEDAGVTCSVQVAIAEPGEVLYNMSGFLKTYGWRDASAGQRQL